MRRYMKKWVSMLLTVSILFTTAWSSLIFAEEKTVNNTMEESLIIEPEEKEEIKNNRVDEEESAGAPEGETAPDGWYAGQYEGAPVWSGNAKDGYLVTFSGEGYIRYDGSVNGYVSSNSTVTISANDFFSDSVVIVEGGLGGFPTQVSVNDSLSGKVFINWLSAVEDEGGKFTFYGLDKEPDEVINPDSHEFRVSNEEYVSGTKVYDVLDMYYDGQRIQFGEYDGDISWDFHERKFSWYNTFDHENGEYLSNIIPTIQIKTADGELLKEIEGGYNSNLSVDASSLAEEASEQEQIFIITLDNRKFWLPIGVTGSDPRKVEDRSFKLKVKEEGGAYAYVESDLEQNVAEGKHDTSIRYVLVNSTNGYGAGIEDNSYYLGDTSNGISLSFGTNCNSLTGYEVFLGVYSRGHGVNNAYYTSEFEKAYQIKRNNGIKDILIEKNAFDSETCQISNAAMYRCPAPGSKKDDDKVVFGVSSDGDSISVEYHGYLNMWHGSADLYWVAVKKSLDMEKIRGTSYDKWSAGENSREYDENYDVNSYVVKLTQYLSEDGTFKPIRSGESYDIYAVYLRCDEINGYYDEEIDDWIYDKVYTECSNPAKLLSAEAGQYEKYKIDIYWGDDNYQGIFPYYAGMEEEPLIPSYEGGTYPYEYSEYGYDGKYDENWKFSYYPLPTYMGEGCWEGHREPVEGDLRIFAIKADDPNVETFLRQTDPENMTCGYEVTDVYGDGEGWTAGEYKVLVFFAPKNEEKWIAPDILQSRFDISTEDFEPTTVLPKCRLQDEDEHYNPTSETFWYPAGISMSYNDICLYLDGDSRKKDAQGKRIPADELLSLQGKPDRIDVTIRPVLYKSDGSRDLEREESGYYDVSYELTQNEGYLTLPEAEQATDYTILFSFDIDGQPWMNVINKKTGKADPTYAVYCEDEEDYGSIAVTVYSKGTVSACLIEAQNDSPELDAETVKKLTNQNAGEAMKKLILVYSNLTRSGNMEDVTSYAHYRFAASPEGSFVDADELAKTGFTAGKTIYIRPSFLGINGCETPIAVKIKASSDPGSDNPDPPMPVETFINVLFKYSDTYAELAPVQSVTKKNGGEKTSAILTEKKVGVWYMEINGSGEFINLTGTDVCTTTQTNTGYSHIFDLKKAAELTGMHPEKIEQIVFYVSLEEEQKDQKGYIAVSPIPSVYYTGYKHVSVAEKGKGKTCDLFVSVYEVNQDGSRELLQEGSDYKLTYKNNINAGKGSAFVTGLGAHKGLSVEKTFTILPASLSENGLTEVTVQGYYKYTRNGLKISPVVKFQGKRLKVGESKDYRVVLLESLSGNKTKVVNPEDYKIDRKDVIKFILRIEGVKNYTDSVESEPFYGVPTGLKTLSVRIKNKQVAWKEKEKESVTAEDFWVSNKDSKVINYDGNVSYGLYIRENGHYKKLESAKNAGQDYYIGVCPADEREAIGKNVAPVPVYVKVKYIPLKFNKALFKLNKTVFDFNGNNHEVSISEKKENSIHWSNTQVIFEGYGGVTTEYVGTSKPTINGTGSSKSLNNRCPDTYSVIIRGSGCYSGELTFTYKVKQAQAILKGAKQNLKVTVNDGKAVLYNAGGLDETHAHLRIEGIDNVSNLKTDGLIYTVTYKKSKKTGMGAGSLKISNICDVTTGIKVFKNDVNVTFDLAPYPLEQGVKLYEDMRIGDAVPYGAIRSLPVEKEVRIPKLTLEQYGSDGWGELDKTDFVTEQFKDLLDLTKAVNIKVSEPNRNGKRFEGKDVSVKTESYGKTWKNARLTFEPDKTECEYTGQPISINVVVKENGNSVDPKYYKVEFANNINLSTAKYPATATVIFQRPAEGGEFKYGGHKTLTYKIYRKYN